MKSMNKRKLIGLIILNPEGLYQQRAMEGIFARCREYGYDVAVFATLVQSCHFFPAFLEGELSIFELINFDMLDAIVVATMTLVEDDVKFVKERVLHKLQKEYHKPVVSLGIPLGDYKTIETDDSVAFEKITDHILDVHKCNKIYFLKGDEGHQISENRFKGFCASLQKHSIELDEKNVFAGDFWYGSGERLADRIINQELELPDAVICASDHMAIGLVNRLTENGIRVPQQVIVTGFDATVEALINDPTITTYIPDVGNTAVSAIDYIRSLIEPGEVVGKEHIFDKSGLCRCMSCGCPEDSSYIKQRVVDYIYRPKHNLGAREQVMDISRLLESYTSEYLTEEKNPDDCLSRICSCTYLIQPYEHFYLCLNNTWLNDAAEEQTGFTDRMKLTVHCFPKNEQKQNFASDTYASMFDVTEMLPQIKEERDEPMVFYFTSIHFNEKVMGYSVLQNPLSQKKMIGLVYRNWMRYIFNALEVARTHNNLSTFSKIDPMTALYNRRGLSDSFARMWENRKKTDKVLVFVIDMDGLKMINDKYGHNEGDFAIRAISSAVRAIARNDEACARAGGDEFYVIGVGDYSEAMVAERVQKFEQLLDEENERVKKAFKLSASIGHCIKEIAGPEHLQDAIQIADEAMYRNKIAAKKQRLS